MIFHIHHRDKPYVQVDKEIINNPNLSWKAKGILIYLLSKPNDWQVWTSDIVKRSTDGITSVRSGVRELINAGYITYHQPRIGNRYDKGVYSVYESPEDLGLLSTQNINLSNTKYTNRLKQQERSLSEDYSDIQEQEQEQEQEYDFTQEEFDQLFNL